MGYERERGVGKSTQTSELSESETRVGKQTLTDGLDSKDDGALVWEDISQDEMEREQLGVIAHQGESETETREADKDKDSDPFMSFRTQLPPELRELIGAAYAKYLSTGKVPPLLDIRDRLMVFAVQAMGPMSVVEAQMFAPDYHWIDGDDASFLAGIMNLAKLPSLTKKRGQAAPKPLAAPSTFRFSFRESIVKKLRRSYREKPKPTFAPRLEAPDSGAFEWLWGALQGDFNQDSTIGQDLFNGVVGMIPVVDQIADVRDISANLYALIGLGQYDQFGPWFNLVASLVGSIPEIGTVIKSISKLAKRGAKNLPIEQALKFVGGGGLETLGRILGDWLDDAGRYAGVLKERGQAIFDGVASTLQLALSTAGAVSKAAREYITRWLERTRAVIAQLPGRITEMLDEIAARLRTLFADVKERLSKLTRRTDEETPGVDTTRTDVTPKAPTYRLATPGNIIARARVKFRELLPTQATVSRAKIQEKLTDIDGALAKPNAVRVIEGHDGKLYIMDGHHTVEAAKQMNRTGLEVQVLTVEQAERLGFPIDRLGKFQSVKVVDSFDAGN